MKTCNDLQFFFFELSAIVGWHVGGGIRLVTLGYRVQVATIVRGAMDEPSSVLARTQVVRSQIRSPSMGTVQGSDSDESLVFGSNYLEHL